MAILTESFYKDVLTMILIIVACVYMYFQWMFNYWKRKGVESVPASVPFGSASRTLTLKVTFGEAFKEVYDKYKIQNGLRYVGFYLFSAPTLVPLDINLIKTILTKDFHHFTDHGNFVNEEDEPLTGHLFALKGQKWRNLLVKLTPTFTSGKMKMMFHTLVNCSTGLKDIMDVFAKKEEVVEIKDVVARYATDVIGSCAFGLDCNSLKNPNSEFRQFGIKVFDISFFERLVRFLTLVLPNIAATLRLRFLNEGLSNFFINAVRQTVNYREKNNVKRNDFMHLLIQLKNNVQLKEEKENLEHMKNGKSTTGNGFTIEQIAAQAFVFFIAGFETSSTTLAFCLSELATNPDIQAKLRKEIRSTLKKLDDQLTYDDIMKMPYMDQCIQETLRKYPPLPLLLRECTETYNIPDSNLVVEKGTRLFISTLGIHHDPEFYPEPEKFDPERFSAENKANRDNFTFLPFGEGPRACIGLRFALMQIKVALAVLLKDYEFTLSNKTKFPLVLSAQGLILCPKGGVWLNVRKHVPIEFEETL